jgi:hypothetical protein
VLIRQSLFKKIGISALAICMLGSLGGEQGEDSLRDALAPALTATGSAARLYFVTQCSTRLSFGHEESYPRFPRLTLAPNPAHAAILEAVREMLRNERDAIATEDRSGIIRITIGVVPTALLNTRITRLTFEPIARWNPAVAIEAIENVSEVTAAMRRLNQQIPLYTINRIVTQPGDNRLPHLPPSLQNVTTDQALDAVARTFRQLVIYGECTQPNGQGILSIGYTPLTECDSHLQGNPCFVPKAKMGWPTPLELSPNPQATTAKDVVTAAISKMNANDAVGLGPLFTEDPTIIDETPPFRWAGPDAVTEWLSQVNAYAATDGLRTFTQSGSDILGIENDRAHFDAPFDVSLPKKGQMGRGQWVFVLRRIGESWKIQEAIWTSCC